MKQKLNRASNLDYKKYGCIKKKHFSTIINLIVCRIINQIALSRLKDFAYFSVIQSYIN